MKTIVVIPARYGSSRMGGKVLAKETGKYLVQHTYERALQARRVSEVLIATDHERVLEACRQFGASCVMTDAEHQSGTDRVAEVAAGRDCDIVINLQADEPEVEPDYIDQIAALLAERPEAKMATLLAPFDTARDIANPNIVKCVTDEKGYALYFSRLAIPYDRDRAGIGPLDVYRRHLGIYAYRKEFLLIYTTLPKSRLEQCEQLEQLRALDNGFRILTAAVPRAWDGIDTLEQYEAFVQRQKNAEKG